METFACCMRNWHKRFTLCCFRLFEPWCDKKIHFGMPLLCSYQVCTQNVKCSNFFWLAFSCVMKGKVAGDNLKKNSLWQNIVGIDQLMKAGIAHKTDWWWNHPSQDWHMSFLRSWTESKLEVLRVSGCMTNAVAPKHTNSSFWLVDKPCCFLLLVTCLDSVANQMIPKPNTCKVIRLAANCFLETLRLSFHLQNWSSSKRMLERLCWIADWTTVHKHSIWCMLGWKTVGASKESCEIWARRHGLWHGNSCCEMCCEQQIWQFFVIHKTFSLHNSRWLEAELSEILALRFQRSWMQLCLDKGDKHSFLQTDAQIQDQIFCQWQTWKKTTSLHAPFQVSVD